MATVRRILALLLVGASGAFVLVYLFVALSRLGYPFELEWMEGAMLEHVRRVVAGQPIYAPPALDFVSLLYPPLYYEASAGLTNLLGLGFLPLRLVSFLSSLGVFALIFAIVRREVGGIVPGTLAVGLFAATYDRLGGWLDLARLDSFYLLLLLGGVLVLRASASAAAAAVAGALLAAAFFTKQSALVVILALMLWAVFAHRRRGLWFAGTVALTIVAGTVLLDRSTEGWFWYYCFQVPAAHPRLAGGLTAFWSVDLLPVLPGALAMASFFVSTRWSAPGDRARFFFPALAAGTLASSWSVRNMVGAEVNNLLPVFAALSILAVLGREEAWRRVVAGSEGRRWVAAAVDVLLLAQLAGLAYDPRRHLPSAADRAAGDGLLARLAAIPGEVWIPHHGYLARLAGKPSHAHTLAMDNLFLDDPGPPRQVLEAEMGAALAGHRFAAVVGESDGRYGRPILASYPDCERLFDRPDVFWPVTGGRLRPEVLCWPRPQPPAMP